jgi:hypothetical protein
VRGIIFVISNHLTQIFEEGELDKDVIVSKMEITTPFTEL